jgi:hypothetical protein
LQDNEDLSGIIRGQRSNLRGKKDNDNKICHGIDTLEMSLA